MTTSRTAKKATRGTGAPESKAGPKQKSVDEIDRLGTMRINELQALYAELTKKPTRCPNRTWLVKEILAVAAPATDASPNTEVTTDDVSAAEAPTTDEAPAAIASVGEVNPILPTSHSEPAMPITAGNMASPPSGSPVQVDSPDVPALPVAAADLPKLSIPELQELYAEILGRATVSSNRGYLVYKLRAAAKGQASVAPRPRHQKTGDDLMVLPLRMEADLVNELDAAWRRQGLRSRMDLIRRSLRAYLASVGETGVAALLAGEA